MEHVDAVVTIRQFISEIPRTVGTVVVYDQDFGAWH